jgi:hypothetical protein
MTTPGIPSKPTKPRKAAGPRRPPKKPPAPVIHKKQTRTWTMPVSSRRTVTTGAFCGAVSVGPATLAEGWALVTCPRCKAAYAAAGASQGQCKGKP